MSDDVDWIDRLGLESHPEGGWFRRIHTATDCVDTPNGPRAALTSIQYLLDRDQPIGHLHRNRSGILHFLQHGGPVDYWLLDTDGVLRSRRLGFGDGEALFLLVPGGCWKASVLVDDASHALIAEVVAPGFDYADHEFADASLIAAQFPQHLAALTPFLRETSRD